MLALGLDQEKEKYSEYVPPPDILDKIENFHQTRDVYGKITFFRADLRFVVYCSCLVVLLCFVVSRCASLSFCVSLCLVASRCALLCLVVSCCVSLRLVASRCVSLCLVVSRCASLCLSVSRCVSLYLAVSRCLVASCRTLFIHFFLKFHKSDACLGQLANSIAPEIYGHEDVKKALLLQMVGGVTK